MVSDGPFYGSSTAVSHSSSNSSGKTTQFKRTNTISNKASESVWRPISDFGLFILYIVADTYLSHDYEYSLRISIINWSYFANSCLFEGNILRFRALASLAML